VSYRWVCKPNFNINSENYGKKLSVVGVSIHWLGSKPRGLKIL